MPRGPKGEKSLGGVNGAAVIVARIATGEIEGAKGRTPNRAKGGKSGGKARGEIPWAYSALRDRFGHTAWCTGARGAQPPPNWGLTN